MDKNKEKIIDNLIESITTTYNENKEAFVRGVKVSLNNSKETLVDYVKKNKKSFSELPFNEVDGLVLAQASYFKLDKSVGYFNENKPWVTLESLYVPNNIDYLLTNVVFAEGSEDFFKEICNSPRFKDILLNHHVDIIEKKTEKQFSATCFKLLSGEIVVAYRGTDSNMIGWKEDVNMAFSFPVPSQISAKEYIEYVYNEVIKPEERLFIVGHSKGGNLATYAFLFASTEIKDKILRVFDYDGPGFLPESLNKKQRIECEEKVMKIIPEDSIVGLFLESHCETKVISSTSISLLQHNALTWLSENNQFVEKEKQTKSILRLGETLNKWVFKMNPEQREVVFEALFTIIDGTKAKNLSDLVENIINNKGIIQSAMIEIAEDDAEYIKKMLIELVLISLNISKTEKIEDVLE